MSSVAVATLAVLGNALTLAYNVPLVWRVVKLWDATNLSTYFLSMRVLGSVVWLFYAAFTSQAWIAVSYTVSLVSSLCLTVVKVYPRRVEPDCSLTGVTDV